jgi:hypothetical protein
VREVRAAQMNLEVEIMLDVFREICCERSQISLHFGYGCFPSTKFNLLEVVKGMEGISDDCSRRTAIKARRCGNTEKES